MHSFRKVSDRFNLKQVCTTHLHQAVAVRQMSSQLALEHFCKNLSRGGKQLFDDEW